jgi:hypothetical protein
MQDIIKKINTKPSNQSQEKTQKYESGQHLFLSWGDIKKESKNPGTLFFPKLNNYFFGEFHRILNGYNLHQGMLCFSPSKDKSLRDEYFFSTQFRFAHSKSFHTQSLVNEILPHCRIIEPYAAYSGNSDNHYRLSA